MPNAENDIQTCVRYHVDQLSVSAERINEYNRKAIVEQRAFEESIESINKMSNDSTYKSVHTRAIATSVSDHAVHQMIERLQEYAVNSKSLYAEAYNCSPVDSILMVGNFKTLLLCILARAYLGSMFTTELYENGSALQYKYNIPMIEWVDTHGKVIEMVVVVKMNKVVTGYFNWVDNPDG